MGIRKMRKVKQIFVLGSSRSGTTMLGRILNQHEDIFTFKELHFFGPIFKVVNQNKILKHLEAIQLLSRLFAIQEHGIFKQNDRKKFNKRSEEVVKDQSSLSSIQIYKFFLESITKEEGAKISCDQTPKNNYYIEEILDNFPEARIINMVRDQRDVLLSQKNKWKRKFLGAKKLPLTESLRSFVQYHPIISSYFWKSSLEHTYKFITHERIKVIKFEDILLDPERKIKELCHFIGINFKQEMLNIPNIGSSTQEDNKSQLMIDKSKLQKWEKGGLSLAEIYLSQKISEKMMRRNKYKIMKFSHLPIGVFYYVLTLPLKTFLALLFNLRRVGNIPELITKRFFPK